MADNLVKLMDETGYRQLINMLISIKSSQQENVEIIDSFISDYPSEINKQIPVWYLGKSIQLLSQADIAYFGGDWANARGYKIEHSIAEAYGIEIVEE